MNISVKKLCVYQVALSVCLCVCVFPINYNCILNATYNWLKYKISQSIHSFSRLYLVFTNYYALSSSVSQTRQILQAIHRDATCPESAILCARENYNSTCTSAYRFDLILEQYNR